MNGIVFPAVAAARTIPAGEHSGHAPDPRGGSDPAAGFRDFARNGRGGKRLPRDTETISESVIAAARRAERCFA